MPDIFIDTNILLYAVSTNSAEASKATVARKILQTEHWQWSAQVAAEFVRASHSPRQSTPLSFADAQKWIELWMAFPMTPLDGPLVLEAIAIAERFGLSYFDAQILAAAKRAGCETVLSEDFNHGQLYGKVRVVNPFI